MTRVLSGAVLLAIAIAVVWFAPALVFLLVAEALVIGGCVELAALARAGGIGIPVVVSTAAAVLTSASFARLALGGYPWLPIDVVLMSAFVAVAALSLSSWRGGRDALATVSASLLPALYLGLPIGAMISIRETHGPAGLFLLMATVFVSDTAQYYTGRALGRTPLAPHISPKKTMEGALGGFVFGAIVMVVVGNWWAPAIALPLRGLIGVTIVALGIAGDLFESMLKRSAGVKDSSGIIPGHGGILDRVDALLFAAPLYYVVLNHV